MAASVNKHEFQNFVNFARTRIFLNNTDVVFDFDSEQIWIINKIC